MKVYQVEFHPVTPRRAPQHVNADRFNVNNGRLEFYSTRSASNPFKVYACNAWATVTLKGETEQ